MWLWLVLSLVLWATPTSAACSGSGVTWTCTAPTTIAQLNTAYASASDGATFTFSPGSYSWSGAFTFNLSKGFTWICASTGCNVTSSGTIFTFPAAGGTTSKPYRISGFTFTHSGGTMLWTCTGTGCGNLRVNSFRFDHNTVALGSGASFLMTGENSASPAWIYGVVDHNTFTQPSTINYLHALAGDSQANQAANTPPAGSLGGANNLFIEDNTFTTTSYTDSGAGCSDNNGGGGAYVFRFNTFTNCRVLSHGTEHAWGIANFEVYGNLIQYNSGCQAAVGDVCRGYRAVHHQGSGLMMVWGNRFTEKPGTTRDTSEVIALMDVGSQNARPSGNICNGSASVDGNRSPVGTYGGYPCKRQLSRDVDALMYPIFVWENRWTSDNALQPGLCADDYGGTLACPKHLTENRDYYFQTGAFNGTVGMGVGLLANRPATCTVGPDSDVGEPDAGRSGVGYWATDQGSWNSSTSNPFGVQQNGADGVLYMCTATNTWSVYYTPYTYPHPLQGGGSPPDTTPPAAPTGLTVM